MRDISAPPNPASSTPTRQAVSQTAAWKALQRHFPLIESKHMRDLFAEDAERFERFSIQHGQLFLDYSKNRINAETRELLLALAEQTGLQDAIESMFNGQKINRSEDRAVLHTALRRPVDQPLLLEGVDVMPEVARVLQQMDQIPTDS